MNISSRLLQVRQSILPCARRTLRAYSTPRDPSARNLISRQPEQKRTATAEPTTTTTPEPSIHAKLEISSNQPKTNQESALGPRVETELSGAQSSKITERFAWIPPERRKSKAEIAQEMEDRFDQLLPPPPRIFSSSHPVDQKDEMEYMRAMTANLPPRDIRRVPYFMSQPWVQRSIKAYLIGRRRTTLLIVSH